MSEAQFKEAIEVGIEVAEELAQGANFLGELHCYTMLGKEFIIKTMDENGKVKFHYEREKHIKLYSQIRQDFIRSFSGSSDTLEENGNQVEHPNEESSEPTTPARKNNEANQQEALN